MTIVELIDVALVVLFWLALASTPWIVVVIIATAPARRRAAERIVVGQIAASVRQNLPLAPALALAAQSEKGQSRRHLDRISRFLSQGVPLSRAVRLGFPGCSALVVSLLASGERAGQIIAAVDQAEAQLDERHRMRMTEVLPVWPYATCIGLVMLAVLTGVMVFVVPRFEAIYADFEVETPLLFSTLTAYADEIGWLFGLFVLGLFLAVPAAVYMTLRPRRLPTPSLISRIADALRWVTPGVRRLEFAHGMSAMLRVMRTCIRAGLDLPQAARRASEIDVNTRLRARMEAFADQVAAGKNVRDAAGEVGLGELTAVVLAGAQRSGNLDAALRFASDYYAAILSRWWIVLRNLVWPVVTLVMGLLVGIVVYALFEPLVILIEGTCDAVGM